MGRCVEYPHFTGSREAAKITLVNKSYYLTTTLPYVNAKPHIGFALEIVQADVLARYHGVSLNEDVFFNTGTDENGKKIYEQALASGKDPQAYVDEYSAEFDKLKKALNLSYNHFIRTTDAHHKAAAQEIWRRVANNGYIEKGVYKAKYCVGCELEKQDSELVEGKCPLHPTKEIELIEEENYFFQFKKLEKKLLTHYDLYPDFVVPAHRQKEIRNFVEAGLTDFSISRLKEKMPWGVDVPDDPKHVMYVWFDALTNYISTLGWPEDEKSFAQYWGTIESPRGVQVAGKDNLRQQSAMWQAMLLAAGLPPTRQILIHGFITSGGQKMSKTLGNVVDPFEYVEKYGTDALRYYLLAKMDPFEDSDFTKEKFEEAYQADLANGLGNLVARVAAMCGGTTFGKNDLPNISSTVAQRLGDYRFDEAIKDIWSRVSRADQLISERKVWEIKGVEKETVLCKLVDAIRQIAMDLASFMPETAEKIQKQFGGEKIAKGAALFPRLS